MMLKEAAGGEGGGGGGGDGGVVLLDARNLYESRIGWVWESHTHIYVYISPP
jgi:hypothetical protein